MAKTVSSRRISGWASSIPLVTAVLVTSWVMRVHGFGFWSQGRLLSVELVTILLPGFVLSTWAGRTGWVVRLSVAFVCGLPVQLLGWFLAITTGITLLAWLLPCLVFLGGGWWARRTLVQELTAPRMGMGVWAAVCLAAMWLVVLGRFAVGWALNPPGDRATGWYQDLYWHLGINASAMQRVPTVDPQVSVEGFSYHWLTNAHIGGLALAADLDLVSLSAVGWAVPIFAVTIGLAYGMANYLTRSQWAGLLAAALVVFPPLFALDASMVGRTTDNFQLLSPSHLFGMPVLLAVVWLVVILLREGSRRWRAVAPATLALLVISPGVKVSSLAVIVCGLLLALVCALVIRRRRLITAAMAAMVAGVAVLTFPLFGGGGGGSSLTLFGSAQQRPIYQEGLELLEAGPQLVHAMVLLGFVLLITLNHLWALSGLFVVRFRDPVAWFLIGVVGSGIGVTFVLVHPGQSQLYFAMAVQPVLAVVTAAGLWHLVSRYISSVGGLRVMAELIPWALASVATGAIVLSGTRIERIDSATVVWQLGTVAVIAGLSAAGARRFGRKRTLAVLCVSLTAYSIGPQLRSAVDARSYALFSSEELEAQQISRPPTERDVSAVELEALQYLATRTPGDSVVATNVHCVNVETTKNCDARAFWVAGLGERQVFLGGWGYTTATRALEGVGGRYHVLQEYADREVFALNEQAFSSPDAEVMRRLSERGVTHLFATPRASSVSEDVGDFCEPLFERGGVLVCSLRDQ